MLIEPFRWSCFLSLQECDSLRSIEKRFPDRTSKRVILNTRKGVKDGKMGRHEKMNKGLTCCGADGKTSSHPWWWGSPSSGARCTGERKHVRSTKRSDHGWPNTIINDDRAKRKPKNTSCQFEFLSGVLVQGRLLSQLSSPLSLVVSHCQKE